MERRELIVGTSLAVVSFPRSGNNYLISFLSNAYPGFTLKASHRVKDLQLKNCFTTIRKPNEAISSYIGFFKNGIINTETVISSAKWYIRFYKDVLSNRVTILDFYKMTSDLNYLYRQTEKLLNATPHRVDQIKLTKNAKQYDYTLIGEDNNNLSEAFFIYNKVMKRID